MLEFTYAQTQRTKPLVVLGVGVLHALALGTLMLSPHVTDPDTQASIALEMVSAPVSPARNGTQAPPAPQPSPSRHLSAAPTPQASPSVTSHTHSTEGTAATASDTRAASSNTGAPAFSLPSPEAQGLNNPKPTYPRLSRRMNEQGQVVIRVFVTADGLPQQGEVKASSGFDRLDQEALRTVMRWRFVPGHRLGTPEAMWFNVPVNFVLD